METAVRLVRVRPDAGVPTAPAIKGASAGKGMADDQIVEALVW
jgi:hypothetical protein